MNIIRRVAGIYRRAVRAYRSFLRDRYLQRRIDRLQDAIAEFKGELATRIKREGDEGSNHDSWSRSAKVLIQEAAGVLRTGKVDSGWNLLMAAKRAEIFGLQPSELTARAEALKFEAGSKMDSWRLDSINALLGKIDLSDPGKITPERIENAKCMLGEATKLKDEHSANLYFRLGLMRDAIPLLVIFLIISTSIAGFSLSYRVDYRLPTEELELSDSDSSADFQVEPGSESNASGSEEKKVTLMENMEVKAAKQFTHGILIVAVIAFGVLGATISAALAHARPSREARIPEQLSYLSITLLRLGLGAASALGLYVFIYTDLVTFVSHVTVAQVLALSFVVGFSERILVRTVSVVSDRSAPRT